MSDLIFSCFIKVVFAYDKYLIWNLINLMLSCSQMCKVVQWGNRQQSFHNDTDGTLSNNQRNDADFWDFFIFSCYFSLLVLQKLQQKESNSHFQCKDPVV